jgi:histidinol-phosphatase (PHP family)
MSWTNFHSHSYYCDGKFSPEHHVQTAIAKGFAAFGCSSHCPVPFDSLWNMKAERLGEYVSDINSLKAKYQGQIQLYLGLEVDFVPGKMGPRHPWIQEAGLDYQIGSIHYVNAFEDDTPWEVDGAHALFLDGLRAIFGNNARRAVERYFTLTRNMVRDETPEVVGHLDKIKIQAEEGRLFSEDESWYRRAVLATLEEIKAAGCIVEINTRGIYKKKTDQLYPSPWIIREMKKMGIPIMLNADSHLPEESDREFEAAASLLRSLGYKQLMTLWDGQWQAFSFQEDGLSLPPA